MAFEFHFQRRVEFSDTDLAGIVHFSNYFRYMEAAEHAFYLSLGFSVHTLLGERLVTWPRVQAECVYRKPLRFEDVVDIHVLVSEKKRKSIRYTFIFRKQMEGALQEVARGTMTVVCVSRDPQTGVFKSMPVPEEIDQLIDVAPESALAGTEGASYS